jgi:hypothetical protein
MSSFAQTLRRVAAIAGMIGVGAASLSGCGGGGSGNGGGTPSGGYLIGSGFSGRSVCAANSTVAGRANWTVLVYMNAANNLQPYSLLNVAQMAAIGSDANMNIVVQWKQASQSCPDCAPNGSVSFEGTHRYYIKAHSQADVTNIANGNTASLEDAGERLADPATNNSSGQSDMGDYRVLQDFINWGTATYPANNLIVVLWDHGSGWLSGPDLGRSVKLAKSRAISFDDQTNNQIEAWQTPIALAATHQPIDVVAVDCSLEQMIEVGYNLKNSGVKILCGSEESPPGAGYPYDAWLADVKAKAANPCAASQLLINDFVAAYPTQTDITQSALDLSKMTPAAAAVDAFASSLLSHISDSASVIAQARTNARSFDLNAGYFNYDIVDFAQQIINTSNKSDLISTATAAQQAVAGNTNPNSVVMYHAYGKSTPTASHGLAIWLPPPGYNYSDYTSLQFAIDYPHWNQFLNSELQ